MNGNQRKSHKEVRKVTGKFRKRPIEVEAYQTKEPVVIRTLEGTVEAVAQPGDWIITGIDGKQYPCPDSIFREAYEPVDEVARQMLQRERPHPVQVPLGWGYPATTKCNLWPDRSRTKERKDNGNE